MLAFALYRPSNVQGDIDFSCPAHPARPRDAARGSRFDQGQADKLGNDFFVISPPWKVTTALV